MILYIQLKAMLKEGKGRDIKLIEDLVTPHGSNGAPKALNTLRKLETNQAAH